MPTPEYQCPKCGAPNVSVRVLVWLDIATDQVDDDDHDWNDNTDAICRGCGHTDRLLSFDAEDDDPEDDDVDYEEVTPPALN